MNETGKALVRFGIDMTAAALAYYGTLELIEDNDRSKRETFKKFFSKITISQAVGVTAGYTTDCTIKAIGTICKALTK